MLNIAWLLAGVVIGAVLAGLIAFLLRKPLLKAFLLRKSRLKAVGHDPIHKGRHPVQVESRVASAVTNGEGATGQTRLGTLADLQELEVSDVMVHRTNMRSFDVDSPPEALVREVLQSPHTRMPLWKGSTENIVGVLHAKDLLRALNEAGNDFSKIDVTKIATKPWFVPDTTTLQDQLNAFLRRKAHFALVVDEYGEVEGLVTLEDIIEEIVGDIADEHDLDMQGVKQESDGSVVVDGTVPIRDLNRALDWTLPDDEATTIAGLVIHETQSIPEERQAFTFHGKRFTVMKRDKNRIARLRIRPVT
jgi:Mg2+/Co2+ transporter CorB